jgi:Undecaprenyl-phosphate galactose phosphotransferase WbaP
MTQNHVVTRDFFQGRQVLVIILLLIVDLVSVALGFQIAVEIRRLVIPWVGGTIPPDRFSPIMLQGLAVCVVIFAFNGLYPGFGLTAVEEIQKIFYSLTLGYGVLALAIYFQQAGLELSRWTFLTSWAFGCLFNMLLRFAARNRFSLFEWWGTPVLVVGPVEQTRDAVRKLINSRRLGLRPVLVLDEACPAGVSQVLEVPVVNSRDVVQAIMEYTHIHYAVYVGKDFQDQILRWLGERFASVLVVLETSPLGSLWVRTMDLEGRLTLKTQYHLLDRRATAAKRAFDMLLGLVGGLILLPFLALIAALIALDSPGPVIFTQERLGKGGKLFKCYKFRTMQVGAEALLQELLAANPDVNQEYQLYHKLANDPRVTRMGRMLRKFSLDELPQIWNVLSGELSLVGPRAYLPREIEDMGAYASLILRISPGLTGWWQVMGRHGTTFEERLRLDEYYLSNWSLWLDVFVIIKTFWILAAGNGA